MMLHNFVVFDALVKKTDSSTKIIETKKKLLSNSVLVKKLIKVPKLKGWKTKYLVLLVTLERMNRMQKLQRMTLK